MTACTFNILIFTIYLGFVLLPSHGFEVKQPKYQTVNADGSVLISCEHTADGYSVEDVRLNSVTLTDKSAESLLCQKGMKYCKNVAMYQADPKKWIFIILNVGEEVMNMLYECVFTLKKDDLDYTKKGASTRLLPGQKEAKEAYFPHAPTPAQSNLFMLILIGLLALMFLCSCIIAFFYIRLRRGTREPENATYVEMRKGPLPRHPTYEIYCG